MEKKKSKQIRVLILASMYPNSAYYLSGMFIHEQVKALKKIGVEVVVFALIPWTPPLIGGLKEKWKKLKKVKENEILDGVEVFHPKYLAIPGGFLKHLWAYVCYWGVKKFAKKNGLKFQDFDLIHVQGALPEDYTAFLLSRLTGLPYVLTVHGTSVYATIKKKIHFKKSKMAIEKANFVIAVSEKVKTRILKFTERKEKIAVIYNGFTPVKLLPKEESDKVIIMFGATLVERKGLKYLLEAFAKLAKEFEQIELWVAGGGPLLKNCKELAREFQVQERVQFLGTVTHRKMLELMNEADIFVLSSWDEAFGVVYLEAMSFKKPVIGTIGEGISEIIEDGKNGFLVSPRNSEEIIRKLKKLILNPQKRKEIGEAGFETVKELTWEKNARKNLEIYQKVLNS